MSDLIWSIAIFFVYILSVCIHEFGHALVAYWGGDLSVKDKGYLTLNPLKYTHTEISIIMPAIILIFGGIPLPGAAVYINNSALRGSFWRSAVSAAGSLATFIVAVTITGILNILTSTVGDASLYQDDLIVQGLSLLLVFEVAGVFLNIIPIPGLDGYGTIEPWLPALWQQGFAPMKRYGVWFLFAAFFLVPEVSSGFWRLIFATVDGFGVPLFAFSLAYNRFFGTGRILFIGLLVVGIAYKQFRKRFWPEKHSKSEISISESRAQALEQVNNTLNEHVSVSLLAKKALLLKSLDRQDEAIKYLKDMANLESDNHYDWLIKAKLFKQFKISEGAIYSYKTFLTSRPDNINVWLDLCRLYMGMKNYKKGIAEIELASQYATEPSAQFDLLHIKSCCEFCLERYEECLKTLENKKAIHRDSTTFYNIACCYAQLGLLEPGIEALSEALEHDEGGLRQQAQTDKDISPLRAHPGYDSLMSKST